MAKLTYPQRLQRSLDFIEANLREDLPLKELAGRANASLYHFHRLFRAFVGQSLKAYIRGRRLTYAARDLVNTRKPIIDIAFDYRYSTPESFLRGFKAIYGMTPRAFRKRGLFRAAHEKADLMNTAATVTIEEGSMEPRIHERTPFALYGSLIYTRHGMCHDEVAAFWTRAREEQKIGEQARIASVESLYGVCFGTCAGCGAAMETGEERFAYLIGWQSRPGEPLPAGMMEIAVPGGTYAVFTIHGGEKGMQDALNRIYGHWLRKSGFELSDSPVLEKYGMDWDGGEDRSMELWLPIRRVGT